MTLTITFNVAKEIISNIEKRIPKEQLLSALVDKNDKVLFKGKRIPINNTSCKGHKILYLTKDKEKEIDSKILSIKGGMCTVIMSTTPYLGENEFYRPYRLGLEVLGIIKDDKFVIKEIKHRNYGLSTS